MQALEANLGVLLSHNQLGNALHDRYGFEYLPFYAEEAEKAGVSIIFFSDRSFLV